MGLRVNLRSFGNCRFVGLLALLAVLLSSPWRSLAAAAPPPVAEKEGESGSATPAKDAAPAATPQPETKPANKNQAKDDDAKNDAKPAAKQGPPRFIRVKRNDDKTPVALETSVTRYVPKEAGRDGVQIDLVGVVHIGEKDYYEKLNERFRDYDVVLYELVAPEGTRVPKGGGRGGNVHPLSALQQGMKSMLALEFQLEHIDYTVKNLVHADMTPEEMAKSMSDRQESWSQMFFRMIGQGIAQQSKNQGGGGDYAMLAALFSKDRPLKLKRILAQQFEDMDASMSVLEGPDGSTLITERNKKALSVLDRELKAGKKRIAVFYGAGHMQDMEKRLLADFGLKLTDEQWLTAWRMEVAK